VDEAARFLDTEQHDLGVGIGVAERERRPGRDRALALAEALFLSAYTR
jgi:hypothetical protein